MILENQVCTFEQAKRLKYLGIDQNSLFIYASFRNESSPIDQRDTIHTVLLSAGGLITLTSKSFIKDLIWYSAFTVAELSQMMPYKLRFEHEECFISTSKFETKQTDFVGARQNIKVERDIKFDCCIASCPSFNKPLVARKYFLSETQAGSLGECLVFLVERNHILVTDANQRLTS